MQYRAAVYYTNAERSAANAELLAAQIRSNPQQPGTETVCVWGHLFGGPNDLEQVSAVVIEYDLVNRDFIAKTYQQFVAGCEIHFFNEKGEFVDVAGVPLEIGNPPLPEATSDTNTLPPLPPNSAVANIGQDLPQETSVEPIPATAAAETSGGGAKPTRKRDRAPDSGSAVDAALGKSSAT